MNGDALFGMYVPSLEVQWAAIAWAEAELAKQRPARLPVVPPVPAPLTERQAIAQSVRPTAMGTHAQVAWNIALNRFECLSCRLSHQLAKALQQMPCVAQRTPSPRARAHGWRQVGGHHRVAYNIRTDLMECDDCGTGAKLERDLLDVECVLRAA